MKKNIAEDLARLVNIINESYLTSTYGDIGLSTGFLKLKYLFLDKDGIHFAFEENPSCDTVIIIGLNEDSGILNMKTLKINKRPKYNLISDEELYEIIDKTKKKIMEAHCKIIDE